MMIGHHEIIHMNTCKSNKYGIQKRVKNAKIKIGNYNWCYHLHHMFVYVHTFPATVYKCHLHTMHVIKCQYTDCLQTLSLLPKKERYGIIVLQCMFSFCTSISPNPLCSIRIKSNTSRQIQQYLTTQIYMFCKKKKKREKHWDTVFQNNCYLV